MRHHEFNYKKVRSLDQRLFDSTRIRQKYPDRFPVIIEKNPNSDIQTIDKTKYIVPDNLTVGQFVYVIRKRINLPPEKAIFVFVNNILPPTSASIAEIFHHHVEEDGFLYVTYSGENVFGG
jgi:GABA(A) receptor-associated protein